MNIHKPIRIEKSWGYEDVIHNDEKYCSKILFFKHGNSGSLHFHLKKTESWFLQKGEITVTTINQETLKRDVFVMRPGDALTILPGQMHRVYAMEDSTIFESSTQHDDNDTIRIER